MSAIRKSTYIAIIMASLTGCQLLGIDYKRPETNLPNSYEAQSLGEIEGALQVSNTWWTLYQDATLNDLVDKALQNNSNIKMAVAKIEEADAYAKEVGAATLPQVTLDVQGTRTRVTEAGAFPVFAANPRSDYIAQFSTSFEVDFWGKLARAKESARAAALSSRFAKDTTALSLTGLVASYYLQLRSLDSQLALSKDSLRSREESLALTKRRLAGGVVSALDVHQAELASSNLLAQIAELKRMRAVAEHQLGVLTGVLDLKLAEANLAELPVPPIPPVGLPSNLLENRPDVRQAEQNLIAANAKIGVAKAALFPTISLTAGLGGESLELGDILKSAARIWRGGVDLYLPIFDSGKLNSRVEQVTAQQKQALANYEIAVQNAFREVNDALSNVRQNTEREIALEASQQSAQKALHIAENRYQSGYSAYIDVLDAQRGYNEAALAYTQTRQARLAATVELFKVLGGGWQSVH